MKSSKSPFQNHSRVLEGLTSRCEKRLLAWMASRMPQPIHSDHLTALGFFSMLLAGLFYALSSLELLWLHGVNLCLILNWFGDSLDGTLARYRRQERPRYGFYVDHILDVTATSVLVGGMALSGHISLSIASVLLVAYLLLSIDSFLTAHTLGHFQMSHWRLGPTEIRLVLIAANLALIYFDPHTNLAGYRMLAFDVGGAAAACIMLVTLVVSSIRNGRALYRMEKN